MRYLVTAGATLSYAVFRDLSQEHPSFDELQLSEQQ